MSALSFFTSTNSWRAVLLTPEVVGDGAANDAAALLASDAAAVAAGRPLWIINQTIRVSTNTTLAADYIVEKGGKFSVDSGVTLTFNGGIQAGDYQIFFGAGNIAGSFDGDPVKLEWWGVPDDGVTPADAAILKAIIAAAQAGVLLQGQPKRTYVLANSTNRIGPALTGAKLFRWKDIDLTGTATAVTSLGMLEIYPDPEPVAAVLTADAAVLDRTITVVSTANIIVDDRYCLISKAFLKTQNGVDYKTRKAEYVTVESKTSTTITFYNTLRSSFLVADAANLFHATYDWKIDFENVTVRRAGDWSHTSYNGINLLYCDILRMRNVRSYKTGVFGFFLKVCAFSGEADGEFHDSPWGYGISTGGCDTPKFGIITGRKMRHILTVSGDGLFAGKSWVSSDGSTLLAPCGRDGYATWVHCDESENAVFDMHVGHFGFTVGAVTGSQRAQAPAAAGIQLESPDVSIGLVQINGGGISIPYYGKWSDESQAFWHFGNVRPVCRLDTTQTAISANNEDVLWHQAMHVHVDSVKARGGGAILVSSHIGAAGDGSGGFPGGDIRFTFDHMILEAYATHTLAAVAGPFGRVFVTGHRADLIEHSSNTGHRPISITGTNYTNGTPDFPTGNAGVHGVVMGIERGTLVADSATQIAIIANGTLRLGPDVTWSTPLASLASQSGIGYVIGSDKRQRIVSSNANITLTAGVDPEQIIISGTITAARTCTITMTAGLVFRGARFRITRKAGTGAFDYDVGPGLKLLPAGTWVEVTYDDLLPGWFVSAYGAL